MPVTASADTTGVGTVGLVLFSVKSYDTATAAQALTPLMARDTTVITFQNGLDNVEGIASVAGAEAVLAGAAYVALQLAGPGMILRTGGEGTMVFGEPSGVLTERVQRIASAFRQSGVPHQVTTDIRRVLWDKFLFITGIGGVTALARSGIGPLLASAAGRSLLRAACAEIVAVAQAEGAHLQPAAVDAFLAQAATLPAPWRPSMARDLDEGRRLEVDALSGAVVHRGIKHGIPTPVHQTIVACLSVHPPSTSTTQERHVHPVIQA